MELGINRDDRYGMCWERQGMTKDEAQRSRWTFYEVKSSSPSTSPW